MGSANFLARVHSWQELEGLVAIPMRGHKHLQLPHLALHALNQTLLMGAWQGYQVLSASTPEYSAIYQPVNNFKFQHVYCNCRNKMRW